MVILKGRREETQRKKSVKRLKVRGWDVEGMRIRADKNRGIALTFRAAKLLFSCSTFM